MVPFGFKAEKAGGTIWQRGLITEGYVGRWAVVDEKKVLEKVPS
jgi:hypothetical protein